MADLAEFLRARLDEDEQEARDAIAEREKVTPGVSEDRELRAWPDLGVPAVVVGPERVLADVAAKRRIIELHEPGSWSEECHDAGTGRSLGFSPGCPTLLALASVYSDHPEFRQEWRTT